MLRKLRSELQKLENINSNLETQTTEDLATIEEFKKIEGQHKFIREKLEEISADCITFRDYVESEFDGVYDDYSMHQQ